MISQKVLNGMSNEDLAMLYQNKENKYTNLERQLAMEALVEKNMALVTSVLKSYTLNARTSWDEMLQAGRIGLFLAADRFDPSLGIQFHTYAVSQIKAAASDEINRSASNGSSNHYATHMKIIKRAIAGIQGEKGSEYKPDAREIRDYIKATTGKDIPISTIDHSIVGLKQADYISLDDENNKNLIVPQDEEDTAEKYMYQAELKEDITEAFRDLPPEEKYALITVLGYPDNNTHTFDQTAKLMNNNPFFIRRHKDKKISAFIVEKYFNNALEILRRNKDLAKYSSKSATFSKIINDCRMEFLPSDEEILDTINEITDNINLTSLPDYPSE